MIASKIETPTPKETDFPKIMMSRISGVVVGFKSPKCGTVLSYTPKSETTSYNVFDYITDWEMANFVDFNSKVTLENG